MTVGEFLQSFVSIRFSQHDLTVLHVIQRARKFLDLKSFYEIGSLLPIVIALNLAKTLPVLAPDMLFSCGDWATS